MIVHFSTHYTYTRAYKTVLVNFLFIGRWGQTRGLLRGRWGHRPQHILPVFVKREIRYLAGPRGMANMTCLRVPINSNRRFFFRKTPVDNIVNKDDISSARVY